MSILKRGAVVLALCVAAAAAAVQPMWEHGDRQSASAAASADDAATSSGFASTTPPDRPATIGPGIAFTGATATVAFVPSRSLAAWHLPSRAPAASPPALPASRLLAHLRSIPLLI